MAQVDVIDKLQTIKDKDYLMALRSLYDYRFVQSEKMKLTEKQKVMLEMSETDI